MKGGDTFLRYLVASLDYIRDQLYGEGWLMRLTNLRILSEFVQLSGRKISWDEDVRDQWIHHGQKLCESIQEIQDRKKPGVNDSSLCHRITSRVDALRSFLPKQWKSDVLEIPDKVKNIIDRNALYRPEERTFEL